MIINSEDTIAAISTPAGEGGIGMIRLSGKDAIQIADKIFRSKHGRPLASAKTHTIRHGVITDSNHETLDEVLASVFRAPNSYTKEDVVEISAHGGAVSLHRILDAVLKAGARMAERGEFTKRAFLNGRLDLTQAEAVLDAIQAKTDRALKAAMDQLGGSLSREIHGIKDGLMKMYAHMEAYLDFPDENLEIYENKAFLDLYESTANRMKSLIGSFTKGEILREGVLAVIIGRPNVGKSSLLNAFLDRDRAIVSDIPGTTRDTLEEMIELDGIPIRLVDTAGFWESSDPLQQAALQRSRQYIEAGDLFLFVTDAPAGVTSEDQKIRSELEGKSVIHVINKADLLEKTLEKNFVKGQKACLVSAKTKFGFEELEKSVVSAVWQNGVAKESASLIRLRHKRSLETSLEALEKSRESFGRQESLEIVTMDLKLALDALREIIGEIYSEDLLDVIFKEFCIGK